MRGFRVLAVAPGLTALVLLAGCGGGSSDGGVVPRPSADATVVVPPPSASAPSVPSAAADVTPDGFSAVVIEVAQDDGTTESFCVWLAETGEERQRGLMQVTSLGGADGMLFRFGPEQAGAFWMKDTILPLSIAFFAGDGAFVSATDMEPCAPDTESCPLYQAAGAYADALEVPQGGLPALGLGAGSRLTATDRSCQPSGP